MNPRRTGSPRKRSVGMLSAFVLIALSLFTPAARAQELRLDGLGGEHLTDADLRQGPWIVVVWASWSPRSRGVAEKVNALARRFNGKARVVTVNFQENRAAVDGFLAGGRFDVPVFLDADGAFAKRYAVANLPGLLVVKGGEAAYRGKLNDDTDQVLAELLP